MKKIYLLYIVFISLATTSLIGYSGWAESKAKTFPESIVSDEYYAALRAYKQTDHQAAFGWFSSWSSEDAYMKSSLAGVLDSVDIVSTWGNWSNITGAQKKDLQFCQQVKGTRSTMCSIIRSVDGQITPRNIHEDWENMGFSSGKEAVNGFWGWPFDESNKEAIEASIRKHASAIADTVNKYGHGGFNIDYEPNFGNPGNVVDGDGGMFAFVDELGKYFGPKLGTDRLLVIDGGPQNITDRPKVGLYLDYFIIQTYNNSSPDNDPKLDRRLITGGVAGAELVQTCSSVMPEKQITKMTIMTEDFEVTDATMDDGCDYTDRYGNKMKSPEGMVRWRPSNGSRKGGTETYHMEAKYGTSPEYESIRRVIRIMSPSSHSLLKN